MGDVVDIGEFREMVRGRRPLYVTHKYGPEVGREIEDFTSRMARIRSSLDRINKLMAELKDGEGDI